MPVTPSSGPNWQPMSGVGQVDERETLDEALRASPLVELGSTGLKQSAGYVDEEFLPQLRGRKAIQVYKEMSENDPVIGALMFTIDRLIRNVEWTVQPNGKTKEHTEAAKFVEECMEDMNETWSDFISQALSSLVYGWSWHEVVYKRRGGPWEKDSRSRSKFSDGRIGWRKMPIRAQETLMRWVFDESGDVRALVQLAPPAYKLTTIPIERSLLFRYKKSKGNPEGTSMLRQAYRPWYMKKRIEEFEAIGVERDLAGMPMVKVPAEYLRSKPGSEQAKLVEAMKKMVKTVRRNEQEGIVFPVAYDQETKQPLFNFELMSSGGGRQFQTDGIIQRYDLRMLMSVLADFILVGHQGSGGSYSLHTDKTGIFRTSLNSITDGIADVLNRYAIPRLFAVNGWKLDRLPEFKPTDVDSPDIMQLSQFMSQMAGLGVQWFPDADLENFVRHAARLPKLDEDEEKLQEKLEQVKDATAFAQANAEYVQTLAQAQQSEQQMQMAEADPTGQGQQQQQLEQQQAQAEQQMQQSDLQQEQKLRHADEAHQQKLRHAGDQVRMSGGARGRSDGKGS